MTGISSLMNVISYDYDWVPNLVYNDDLNMQQHACHSINQLDTLKDVDKLSTNQKSELKQINNELNQYYSFANEMPVIEMMNEIDYENGENEDEDKWKDKLKKHRKTSNFGFTSLQKRIEKVKHDIINLTNKLNAGYVQNGHEVTTNDTNTYYNLGFGNIVDNEPIFSDDDNNKQEIEEGKNNSKTWKCPSQFNLNNPYSELSENTQKILNKLHLNKDEINLQIPCDKEETVKEIENELEMEDDDMEMEEDEIEFTFCTSQSGLLQSFLSKGTLPIIDEEEELDSSSSEEETDSIKSILIENLIIDTEIDTPKTLSLQSMDFTDSESFITALTNPEIANQSNNDKTSSSFEDAEENFSDYARYSVSSHSSKESLNSCNVEKLDNETVTEKTLVNQNSNIDCSFTIQNIHEISSSSLKIEESSDSDAEYDNSTWSNEDILQSIEQSDSLYEKPAKSLMKSSLPDLIESTDNCDLNNRSFFSKRNFSKSTDLDEIMEQYHSPHHETSINRLSLSLCNLNSSRIENKFCPQRFFQETVSQSNLLETDLDSGFVSIYQPIKETEILPSVDFSCSMVNINEGKSPVAFNSLIEKLRSKAGSIPELRVANSLNKLNVPDWLNYRNDEFEENLHSSENSKSSFPAQSLTLPPKLCTKSPVKQAASLPRSYNTVGNEPPIKPQLLNPVILPSQKFRQLSQKSLTPIKSCRARELLMPTKIAMGTF